MKIKSGSVIPSIPEQALSITHSKVPKQRSKFLVKVQKALSARSKINANLPFSWFPYMEMWGAGPPRIPQFKQDLFRISVFFSTGAFLYLK